MLFQYRPGYNTLDGDKFKKMAQQNSSFMCYCENKWGRNALGRQWIQWIVRRMFEDILLCLWNLLYRFDLFKNITKENFEDAILSYIIRGNSSPKVRSLLGCTQYQLCTSV